MAKWISFDVRRLGRIGRSWFGKFVGSGVLAVFVALASADSESLNPESVEFFESRIRPVLAQECYQCHSQAGERKGGLLLDHRAGWQAGGNSGPVIVPGKPAESLLLRAIRHEDEDLKMPQAGAQLDEAIIRDFVRWISLGAPDPRDAPPSPEQFAADTDWNAVMQRRKNWWSFQPVANPSPPAADWSDHPVDRFLQAKREIAGLDPVEPADAHTLVRRLYFALIGLPPLPEQISAFVADHAEDPERAVEALTEELLASPQFGERWARHWMDWIRYAESHGSEGDPQIGNAHLYRNYIIRALNSDTPYDQLVREHVAGDLLEAPRFNRALGINESVIGTAHWRMVFHGFAPTDALDERVRFTDDQINTFSKTFLGLTVSCARCHDHKFDPISQRDYYAFFGVLGSARPGRKPIDTPERLYLNRDRLAEKKPGIKAALAEDWLGSLTDLEARLAPGAQLVAEAKGDQDLLHLLHAIDRDAAGEKPFEETWKALSDAWLEARRQWAEHVERDYPQRWRLYREEDAKRWFSEGVGLKPGLASPGEFSVAPEGESALLGIYSGGVFTHLLSSKHGGRFTSPDYRLDQEYDVWLRVRGDNRAMTRYVVQNYPRSGTVYPVRELRGDNGRFWRWERFSLDYWTGDDVHFEVTTGSDAPLLVRNEPRSWFGIREAVVSQKGGPRPPDRSWNELAPIFDQLGTETPGGRKAVADAYAAAVSQALTDWKEGQITDAQADLLDVCLRLGLLPNALESLPAAQPLIAEWRKLENAIPVPVRVPSLSEWKGRNQPLFERGNHRQPKEPVPRRFLEAIDDSPYETRLSGRRQLAEDLLRDDNPLPRRVIVNRVWHHLFGKGLVSTPDNFGRLGAKPTHPELLDHLATRFVERDRWSLKGLIRYLVTTRTWQLDSRPSEAAKARDPANDWLSHFTVRRLEAEAIRDSMLHVSGALDLTPSDRPVNGRSPKRSVYMNVIRNRMDSFLRTFDLPVPFSTHGRRNTTTVPGQSLTLMNDGFVQDLAAQWGRQLRAEAAETDRTALIDSFWLRAFASVPSLPEREITAKFLADQEAAYQEDVAALSRMRRERDELKTQHDALLTAARIRWREAKPVAENDDDPAFLQPVAQWLFEEDARDSVGSLHAKLEGDARIEDGALVLSGNGAFARSVPLTKDLTAKSLEARVQLDGLNQQGGAALTVQNRDGGVFDALVYGERNKRFWLAGSDNHRRTKDFPGGSREKEAEKTPIHFVIVYREDGTVAGYRNGEPYGKSYQAEGPASFRSGQAEVLFGLRHGKPSGDRLLKGRILEARLYDRALSADEVAAVAAVKTDFISKRNLLSVMTEEERENEGRWERRLAVIEAELAEVESLAPKNGESEVWTDLALSIFNMKEFIYVR